MSGLASLFVLRMSLSMLRRAKHVLSFPDATRAKRNAKRGTTRGGSSGGAGKGKRKAVDES